MTQNEIPGMNQQEDTTPLYNFYVRGVQFHQLKTVIDKIKVGDVLMLVLEPTNRFDPNAIRIEFDNVDEGNEVMLGYVPKEQAAEVGADLIVSHLQCTVTEVNKDEKPWKQLRVKIEEVPNA